jgi:hypothetical protein
MITSRGSGRRVSKFKMHKIWCFFCVSFLAGALAAPPAQLPLGHGQEVLQPVEVLEKTEKKRPLHGRFLQITGKPRQPPVIRRTC